MLKKNYRAVLFDLDGTLADSALDLGGALNFLRQQQGLPTLSITELRPHVSGGAKALIRAGFGLGPEDAAYADLQQRFLDYYQAHSCVATVLFNGIAELLDELDARQIPWGIVTNKAARFTQGIVAALGLAQRAKTVVSGDTAAKPKPAPEPILYACQEAGINPVETLYVGDDLRDVQAGLAAGTGTIATAWGYLGSGEPIEAWGADAIIQHPHELLSYLVAPS